MIRLRIFIIAAAIILANLTAPLAIGEIIYVDDTATGSNVGTSWENAYIYLQDALAAAASSDEIRVAQGSYKPDLGIGITPGNRSATFQLKSEVTIAGGFAGFGEPDPNERNIQKYDTILSGDLMGNDITVSNPADLRNEPSRSENSEHIVTGIEIDKTAVLNGFTITGGNDNFYGGGMLIDLGSPTVTDCNFVANSAGYKGGGIYISGYQVVEPNITYVYSPTFNNCTFVCNAANEKGGAIYNYHSDPNIIHCTFENNWSQYGGGIWSNYTNYLILDSCIFSKNTADGSGGGIVTYNSERCEIIHCTFSMNIAGSGGGIRNDGNLSIIDCMFIGNLAEAGGGGTLINNSVFIDNCTFIGNSAGNGGGTCNSYNSEVIITNCKYFSNTASGSGGAISNDSDATAYIINCLFSGNSATNNGGGIYNWRNQAIMIHDSIISNYSGGLGAGVCDMECNSNIVNSILWGNVGMGNIDEKAQLYNPTESADINYCCIQGWTGGMGGIGNIGYDPQIIDPNGNDNILGTEDDNLRLLPDSHCIDAGTNSPEGGASCHRY